jgi:excisionase family DNA binding protein
VTETSRPRTIEEAAQELGLSKHTLYTWIAHRRIGYVRLGRAVRIPRAEIARLLDGGSVPAVCSAEQE